MLTLAIETLAPQQALQAQILPQNSFNPSNIISDGQAMDYASMGLAAIQEFLQQKGSFLANYITDDIDGAKRTAAEMIFRASNNYKISPKFLLTTLQKEQSLIDTNNPSAYQLDWATGYGRCDNYESCGPDMPLVQKFKGFAKQVDYAAGSMRFFFDNPDKTKLKPGKIGEIDGQIVIAQNQATANLYAYTPHLHGNLNFYKIFSKWFATPFYPDGTILQDRNTRETWLIQNQKRRKLSRTALISRYSLTKIIPVAPEILNNHEIGFPLKYAQYSLLQTPKSKVYLVIGDQIRPIASTRVFQSIGFSPDEIIPVKKDEFKAYDIGPEINTKSLYPTGALLQDKLNGGIFYVENGMKHAVLAREMLKTNFAERKNIIQVGPDKLNEFATGDPIKFKDGELVKSLATGSIYVISHGQKLGISSQDTFDRLGYSPDNVITVSDQALALHPDGEPLN